MWEVPRARIIKRKRSQLSFGTNEIINGVVKGIATTIYHGIAQEYLGKTWGVPYSILLISTGSDWKIVTPLEML